MWRRRRTGEGGGDSGVDKYRSVRGVQHVRAVDCRRLKPTIAASITRNPFGLGVGLALPRRTWIDITGRGIPRPCHVRPSFCDQILLHLTLPALLLLCNSLAQEASEMVRQKPPIS